MGDPWRLVRLLLSFLSLQLLLVGLGERRQLLLDEGAPALQPSSNPNPLLGIACAGMLLQQVVHVSYLGGSE